MSLQKKFTLYSVLLVTLVVAFLSWQIFESEKRLIKETQKAKADLLSEIADNGLKTIMLEGRGREFQKFLNTLVAEDIASVRIYTQTGTILSSSIPGEVGKNISARSREPAVSPRSGYEKSEVYSKIVLIKNDRLCRKCHGGREGINGILDVEISTNETDRMIMKSAKRIAVLALAAVVILSASLSAFGFRQVTRPLYKIMESVKKAENGDAGVKIRAGEKNELTLLADSLDSMLSDLRRSREEIFKCTADKNMYIERMASLGELAAAVAHDIKNPLAGISGALQVLAEDFPEDSPRKEIAQEILSEIGRLDAAVKDLLIYARPPELNLILTDINAIIEKVIKGISKQAAELNVTINSISDNITETLADPDQLERALTNIALYSLQLMQDGGALNFATYNRYATGEIEIALSDTGGGVRSENAADVFKPSFSTKHSGTGLGLAISRNIVESHKGRIDVENLAGVGSTFRIFLRQKR